MNTLFRFPPYGRKRLRDLDHILDDTYGAPEALLGNQRDPLAEAVYIVLSFQTDLPRFMQTWQTLRSAFPSWRDVERASVDEIAGALRAGGLHQQKARTIKRLLQAVRRQSGTLSLDRLRVMTDADAEEALTRLPGLSWKGARCVLLYSLDRATLPVDSNAFRILQRAGVIPTSSAYRRRSLHDAVQAAVDPDRRRRFHVNLVVHGQQVCLTKRPQCATCPAASACAQRGLPHLSAPSRSHRAAKLQWGRRVDLQSDRPAGRAKSRLLGSTH
jgi:endonuclease III